MSTEEFLQTTADAIHGYFTKGQEAMDGDEVDFIVGILRNKLNELNGNN